MRLSHTFLCTLLAGAGFMHFAPSVAHAQNFQQSECRGVSVLLQSSGSTSSTAPLIGPCVFTAGDHELRVYRDRLSLDGQEFEVAAERSVRLEQRDGGVILTADDTEITRISPVPALEALVAEGDLEAHLNLAQIFIDGEWAEEDRARAAELLILPAEAGNTAAQGYLAVAYNDGLGVEANPEEAMRWAALAQEENSNARRLLANGLYTGEGIAEDVPRAMALWASAAEDGDAIAAYNLGVVVEAGVKVAFNRDTAIAWFEMAVELGNEDAQARLDALRN